MLSQSLAMKFKHVSLPSRDVGATATFFERYLGCTGSWFDTSKILKRHDFDIVIEDAAGRPVDWPGHFHIGFELAGVADLKTGILRYARGSRFFCAIPGGVLVEINTRTDAAEPYRASFR